MGVLVPGAETVRFTVEDWLQFYQRDCGIAILEKDLTLPPAPDFPHWLVVEPAALTPNMAYAAMEQRFDCRKSFETLDSFERTNPFDGVRAYFIRARVDPDEELKCCSAEILWRDGVETMTLQARCALECLYFGKTKAHLDRTKVTICAGSMDHDFIPFVYCLLSGRCFVRVGWIDSSSGCSDFRARQAFA
jgi:hypothetical protein